MLDPEGFQTHSTDIMLHPSGSLELRDIAPHEPGADIVDTMSGKENGLGGQVQSMEKMAEAIAPIVGTFNSILVGTNFAWKVGLQLTHDLLVPTLSKELQCGT